MEKKSLFKIELSGTDSLTVKEYPITDEKKNYYYAQNTRVLKSRIDYVSTHSNGNYYMYTLEFTPIKIEMLICKATEYYQNLGRECYHNIVKLTDIKPTIIGV